MIELQTEEEKKALFGPEPVSKESPLHTAVALKNGRITALLLKLSHPADVLDGEGCG